MGPLGDQLLADLGGMLGISAAIVGLLVLGEVLRRRLGAEAEHTRKLVHVGAGAVVLSMPWVLAHGVSAVLLGVLFAGILAAGKVTGVLGSVHGVARRTRGAYYYPFAVSGTFVLAEGEPLRFCVPMAVMAVADTAAAMVGHRWGERRYAVGEGYRTLEGTAAFFVLALAIFLGGLLLDGRVSPLWAVAVVGAVATTAVEAVSLRGSDNLLIPLVGLAVLDQALRHDRAPMDGVVALLVALPVALWLGRGGRVALAGWVVLLSSLVGVLAPWIGA